MRPGTLASLRPLALATSVLTLSATVVQAQQGTLWQGAVKPDHINVYSQASTSESVVRTLSHGEVVNVVLEVRVSSYAWCRIGFPDEHEPIGYVLCMNLQQVQVSPRQKARNAPDQPSALAGASVPATADAASANATALTNNDILEMSKIGLSSDVLVAKIKASICNFDTSPRQLKQLKAGGIPDAVILAMVQAPVGQAAPRPPAPDPPATTDSSAPNATEVSPSDGKLRVFVTDSQSWEERGGGSAGGNRNGWGASSWFSGGARPQTAEIIKTLNQRCPEITVTNNLAKADFALILDHEGGKSVLAHRNKIVVFNRAGDDIFSTSTRELGNAVKDACQAMLSTRR